MGDGTDVGAIRARLLSYAAIQAIKARMSDLRFSGRGNGDIASLLAERDRLLAALDAADAARQSAEIAWNDPDALRAQLEALATGRTRPATPDGAYRAAVERGNHFQERVEQAERERDEATASVVELVGLLHRAASEAHLYAPGHHVNSRFMNCENSECQAAMQAIANLPERTRMAVERQRAMVAALEAYLEEHTEPGESPCMCGYCRTFRQALSGTEQGEGEAT